MTKDIARSYISKELDVQNLVHTPPYNLNNSMLLRLPLIAIC